MSQLKTIVKGAAFVFAGMAVSKVLTYAWRVLLARQGSEVYGLFSLGIAILTLGMVISATGLCAGVGRFVAFYHGKNDTARIKGVITTSLKITFAASIVLGTILFFSANFLANEVFKKPQLEVVLQVFSFALPALALRYILMYALTALQKIEHVVVGRDVLDSVYKIILAAVPVLLGWGLFELSVGYAIATFLTLFTMLYFLEKTFPIIHTRIQSIRESRELLVFSLPLSLATLFDNSLRWTDTLFLGFFTSASTVGVYNAVLPTAMLLSLVPTALLTLYGAVITHEYAKENKQMIERLYRTVSRWILITVLPMFLFMVFFPTTIMYILFGAEYSSGGRVLAVLAMGYFTLSIFLPGDHILNMLKRTSAIFIITTVGLAVNLLLNLWLIPQHADFGAALASAVSLSLMGVLSLSYVHHYTGILPFGKRAIAVVIASAVVFYAGQQVAVALGLRLLPQLGIFAILTTLYALIVWKLKLIEQREVEMACNYLLKVTGRK